MQTEGGIVDGMVFQTSLIHHVSNLDVSYAYFSTLFIHLESDPDLSYPLLICFFKTYHHQRVPPIFLEIGGQLQPLLTSKTHIQAPRVSCVFKYRKEVPHSARRSSYEESHLSSSSEHFA
jgi:hypothetical protein